MAENLVSPGISIAETDRSAYAARPLVAGAALIGPTVKGAPFIPTKVTSYGDYCRRFGTTFVENVPGTEGRVKRKQEFLTSMAAKSYFEQGGESILVVRVAPFLKDDDGNLQSQFYTEGVSTDIPSVDGTGSAFTLRTLSCGDIVNNVSGSTYKPYPNMRDIAVDPKHPTEAEQAEFDASASVADERQDGSLKLGNIDDVRFEVSNVDEEVGTFSLTIRQGNDTDKDKIVLEQFNNLSLDPDSPNYIRKVIGDQHAQIKYDDAQIPYVDVVGDYTNKSAYVYVSECRNTLGYLCNDGVTVNWDIDGKKYSEYLPVEGSGGFYGATGKLGAYPGDPIDFAPKYYDEITEDEVACKYPQGVMVDDYGIAIDLLDNMDEYQINILSAPGLLNVDKLSKVSGLCESRGDVISVVDLSDCNAGTRQAAENAQKINSSYAATYFPWLQMFNNCGRLVWVPASVVIPGVYVFNDKQAAPWYAPAGMLRGGVQGVVQTRMKLTKAHRDTLYKKNVNPIGTFPGSGIVVYGQKTLQKKQTALDRVNARRLLIELKRTVREMASHLLFEHNTASVRNAFRAKVEPYLESVVQRNGLYAYKVVIDELNDADTIDRNEFRCQIYVQPTKVIEFIYIDFTITATGVEFN